MAGLTQESCIPCRGGVPTLTGSVSSCNWEWKNRQRVFEAEDAPYLDPNATKRTYAYMMTDVVPTMLKSGFGKKEIDTFLVENPHRFFS